MDTPHSSPRSSISSPHPAHQRRSPNQARKSTHKLPQRKFNPSSSTLPISNIPSHRKISELNPPLPLPSSRLAHSTLNSGTYQAYLRRNPAHLQASLDNAQKEGYILGVKLVRGAYHEQERKKWRDEGRGRFGKDPIWDE